MAFKTMFEAPEVEAARLAQSPVGSRNHALSQIPVNIKQSLQDLMIELPHFEDEPRHTIVVVPVESHRHSTTDPTAQPRRRYNSSWTCIVVASDHPSYPVGSYRISLPEYQLVRGTHRTLTL
jgi:hypothetical protein